MDTMSIKWRVGWFLQLKKGEKVQTTKDEMNTENFRL